MTISKGGRDYQTPGIIYSLPKMKGERMIILKIGSRGSFKMIPKV